MRTWTAIKMAFWLIRGIRQGYGGTVSLVVDGADTTLIKAIGRTRRVQNLPSSWSTLARQRYGGTVSSGKKEYRQ